MFISKTVPMTPLPSTTLPPLADISEGFHVHAYRNSTNILPKREQTIFIAVASTAKGLIFCLVWKHIYIDY